MAAAETNGPPQTAGLELNLPERDSKCDSGTDPSPSTTAAPVSVAATTTTFDRGDRALTVVEAAGMGTPSVVSARASCNKYSTHENYGLCAGHY